MRMLFVVALAVGGGVASYLAPSPVASAPNIDPTTTAALGGTKKLAGDGIGYTVANIAGNAVCLMARSKGTATRTSAVHAETACDDVWPHLSDARNWTRNPDGSVILSDASGAQVLELVPGDGIAYQAIEPPSAQIVLTLTR